MSCSKGSAWAGMSEVDLARQRMVDEDFVRFVVIKRMKTDRRRPILHPHVQGRSPHHQRAAPRQHRRRCTTSAARTTSTTWRWSTCPGSTSASSSTRFASVTSGSRSESRCESSPMCCTRWTTRTPSDGRASPCDIVHRDVNPRNIMVSMHGETKLIDFGVAKAAGRLERTKTDHVKGKFSYMAPEQIKAEIVDGRADLFAVGLTLHEFLVGYGPFYGLNQVQIVHRLLQGRIPGIPDVKGSEASPELKRLHDRSLAVDPDDRYPDAASMRADLMLAAKAAGGLPSRAQLARFLVKVDPRLTERLTEKMDRYSGELPAMSAVLPSRPPAISRADVSGEVSGTMEGVPVEPGGDLTYTQTVSRTAVVGGGIAAGVVGMIVTAVVILVVLLVVVSATMESTPPGPVRPVEPVVRIAPAPSPVEPAPLAVEPDPVPDARPDVEPAPAEVPAPVTRPDPAPRPDPIPRPDPAPRPDPVPEPVRPDPVTPDVPPPPEPAEPEPVEPEPVVPEPVVPDPVPEPMPPDPARLGTLMVNASRAAAVYVDGQRRGTTPLRIELPAGTYQIRVEGQEPRTVRVSPRQVNPVLFP